MALPKKQPVQISGTPCECGNHYFAPLTKGYVTLVSPEDARLLDRKWCAMVAKRRTCAFRKDGAKGLLLAREILQPDAGLHVDHINCDATDNRRSNLRICTREENNRNTRKRLASKNPFKGVNQYKSGSYSSKVTVGGVVHNLGTFATPELARDAYAAGVVRLHGEFARLA
jgi:hypothetical protein